MKNKIPAVFKEDLEKLLISLNELEPINNGDRNCKVCLKIISIDNIQLIIPRADKKIDYICNNPICLEK